MTLRMAIQVVAAVAIFGVGAVKAGAQVMDYTFSTTVDYSTFQTVQPGDAFTISYSVDTSIPPSGSTTFADFNNVSNLVMTAGVFTATAAQGIVRQIDDPTLDQYLVYSGAAVGSLEGLDIVYFTLELYDPTGTAISDALTLADPSLNGFSAYVFWAVFASGSDMSAVIRGQFSYTTVPEPATLALLALGIAAIGFSKRKPALARVGARVVTS